MAMRQYDPFQVESNMQFKENEETEGNNSFPRSSEGNLGRPRLGLKLTITTAFIDLIESTLAENRKKKRKEKRVGDFNAESEVEKLKASNLPASLLKIGSWERIPKNEGDLIAKLYYSKRKFVLEMLEESLKNKIEIQWLNISAIRAHFPPKAYAILEIELNQPPCFFRETNPQPRKHTIWELSSDFTGGQAQTYRRHTVYFPPGTLETPYINLLQKDKRLRDLSRKSFPGDENPFFHQRFSDFPSNFNGSLPQFSHVQPNHPIQNLPILPAHPTNFEQNIIPISPMLDGGSSYYTNQNQLCNPEVNNQIQGSDEGGSSYYANKNQGYNSGVNNQIQPLDEGGSSYYANQNQSCNPGVNNQNQPLDEGGSSYYANGNQLCNTQVNNEIRVLDSIAVATIPGNANQNYYYLNRGEDLSATMNNPNSMFDNFDIQLPENFRPTYLNEMEYLPALDLQQAVANTIPDPPQQLNWLLPHQHSNTIPYPPQQPNWSFPHQQVSDNNTYVNSSVNPSLYPNVGPTQLTMEEVAAIVEDFAAIASRPNIHHQN